MVGTEAIYNVDIRGSGEKEMPQWTPIQCILKKVQEAATALLANGLQPLGSKRALSTWAFAGCTLVMLTALCRNASPGSTLLHPTGLRAGHTVDILLALSSSFRPNKLAPY